MAQSDDEVEIIEPERHLDILVCQLCNKLLHTLTLAEREEHYDRHFPEEPPVAASTSAKPHSTSGASGSRSPWKQSKWKAKTKFFSGNKDDLDVFWYPSLSDPPPSNFTPGMIPLLKKALLRSHAQGKTLRAALCYERAVYVGRQSWDTGWGCGYRNFLMACTSLMDQPFQPMYFPLMDEPVPPSVRNLQSTIEDAWKAGYDREGYAQLKGLVGTRKWVGTSDLCTAFTFRGIPAELVDFDIQHSPRGIKSLLDWIVQYFSGSSSSATSSSPGMNINQALRGASPVTITDRMPIILQHAGHSRSVVGYELTKGGNVDLLIFDSSKLPSKEIRNAALAVFKISQETSTPSSSKQFKKTAPFPPVPSSANNQSTATKQKRRVSDTSLQSTSAFKRNKSDPLTEKGGKVSHENVYIIDDSDEDEDDEVVFVSEMIKPDDSPRAGPAGKRKADKKDKKAEEPPWTDVVKHFKMDAKRLGKQTKYQILYFPMTEPFNDREKNAKKVLTSTKII